LSAARLGARADAHDPDFPLDVVKALIERFGLTGSAPLSATLRVLPMVFVA